MDTLFEARGTLTSAASKSQVTYQFYVPAGCEGLRAHFKYFPKELNDREQSRRWIEAALDAYVSPTKRTLRSNWEDFLPLSNLITLSFDDPERFRGAAHRHAPEQHYWLTPATASDGLIRGDIPCGMWRITLSVHGVVTPQCEYGLTVWKGGASS